MTKVHSDSSSMSTIDLEISGPQFFWSALPGHQMEIVLTLAPIVCRACRLEDMDPQDAGKFIRTLCLASGLDDGLIHLLFEHILSDLVDTDLLESCEFHEALDGTLSAESLSELLVGAYQPYEGQKLAQAVTKLYGGEVFKPRRSDWALLRKNISPIDFRQLAVSLAETNCEKPHHIPRLLLEMYDADEEYEIAETTRMLLERNWILDILPEGRKAARQILYKQFVTRYPFLSKAVADFCRDMLRLEPLTIEDGNSASTPSSDSDIESRGSLDDFIADSDEDGDDGSDIDSSSSEESASSEESSLDRKKKHKIESPFSSSSSSSSSSSDSDTHRKHRRR